MTPVPNLLSPNTFGIAILLGLAMLSQSAFAQGSARYPLHPSSPAVLAEPSQNSGVQTANLTIRDLPAMDAPTIEQQSFQSDSNPVAEARDAFTNSFESAYGELSAADQNPPVPSRIASSQANGIAPATSGLVMGGGGFEPTNSNNSDGFASFKQDKTPAGSDVPSNDTESMTWWKQQVLGPLAPSGTQQSVDTNSIVYNTLKSSPRILALSQNPLIREVQVVEADAEFDPTSFVRNLFQDRVDPVGDNLSVTNDGSAFQEEQVWTGEFGIRRKLRTGATYELGQNLGFKNSNSAFFNPQDQGTAQLALNVTQPLMRGRGRYYNQSQVLIAQSATGASWNTFLGELQDEIERSVVSYWKLYFYRSLYLQKKRNVSRGEEVLRILEGRADLDSLPSQITRARSAVQSRKTDLANARRDIRDAETEIRRLTADRNWQANQSVELVPNEIPSTEPLELGLDQVVFTALENRPEIKETMIRAKIAGIQRDISVNELMPELSLLLGGYVSALEGDSQLGQAIVDQFSDVKPGYSVGLEFEFPIRNRAARSRLAQRKLQLSKIKAEVDETMQNVVAESQISLRRVTSAKETMDAAAQAIEAAQADLEQNYRRWESFALVEGDIADGQTPTTILDQLLDSQERLTAAELVYTQSELELKSAEVALQRTMGTLIVQQNISFSESYNCDIPEMQIHKSGPVNDDVILPVNPNVDFPNVDLDSAIPPVPANAVPAIGVSPSNKGSQYQVYPINDPTWDKG